MKRPIELGNGVSIGQPFGDDPQGYAQFKLAGHHGVDYPAPTGTPVQAPEAGIVTISSNGAKDPYTGGFIAGETVVVRGANHEHWLMHLSVRNVGIGQHVGEGQTIGLSGNTGYSTGPHLHWGVRPNNPDMGNGFRGFVNPQSVLTVGTAPQTPAPQHSGNTVTLPAHVPSWAVYREGSGFRKGTSDQVGALLPARFGGLTYDIQGWVSDNAVIIDTKSYGRVALWVKGTDAIISKTVIAPPPPAPTPPVYNAPTGPVRTDSPKYQSIVKDIPGYMTANNAVNRLNPLPNPVKAGSDYFVFTNKYGMDNVTLVSGQPGAWINPADNVPDPIPEPIVIPEPPKFQIPNAGGWNPPSIPPPLPELPQTPPPEPPQLPTTPPEDDWQSTYHAFAKPVWYKAVTDTFVRDMTTHNLIALSEDRELPIHGTFTESLVFYGKATKKGSESWYGVPLADLTLAPTKQQKLEAVKDAVLKDPAFIEAPRPKFDKISHTVHITDLVIEKVFDIFRPRVKNK